MTNEEAISVLNVIGLFAIDRASLDKKTQATLEQAIDKGIRSLEAWAKVEKELNSFLELSNLEYRGYSANVIKECINIVEKYNKERG